MVTPTTGAVKFIGLRTKQQYQYSIYISDVAAAPVTWSKTGIAVAASPTDLILPEDCAMVDISVITGPTVITGLSLQSNNAFLNVIIPLANTINTIQSRQIPVTGFKGGNRIGIIQA